MKRPVPKVEVVATGRFLPDNVVTNADLEKLVDTNDAWITERTGIKERRLASKETLTAEMGAAAAKKALAKAGVEAGEVDLIIVTTATPDRWLPSTACDLQSIIGAGNAFAYDLNAACSGFLYALTVAEGHLMSGRGEVVLVVSTEKMSSIIDWEDRATCVLFGDGAGAAVLKRSDGVRGIISSHHRSDGDLGNLLYRPGGGVAMPLSPEVLDRKDHLVKMSGREVFKAAVRSMAEASSQALLEAGLTGEDIALMVPHQANLRIIEATAKYADIPMEKVYVTVQRYGNVSSATIPIALDEALEEGRINPGDYVLSTAFGAGLTWGATVFRW